MLTVHMATGSHSSGLSHGQQFTYVAVKELLPLIVECVVWGDSWRGKTVKTVGDNAAIINSARARIT